MDIRNFRIPYQGRNIYSNVVVGGTVSNLTNITTTINTGTDTNPEQGGSQGGNTPVVTNNGEWYNIHTEKISFEVGVYSNAFTTLYDYDSKWQYYITQYYNTHGFMADKYVTVYKDVNGTIYCTEQLEEGIRYTVTTFTDTQYYNNVKMMTIGDEVTVTKTESHGLITDFDSPFLNPDDLQYRSTQQLPRLYTLIDNFSTTLQDNTKYKIVLLKWKRGKKRGKNWRVPMFSPLWSNNMDGTILHSKTLCDVMWEECCWDINGNRIPFFNNTYRIANLGPLNTETDFDVRQTPYYNGSDWSYSTRKVFKQGHTVKQTFGVAIYKNTGDGRFGWQRISNIAPIDLYLTRGGDIITCPRVND